MTTNLKVWLLYPYEDRPRKGVPGRDPWEPWYDKLFRAVVLAETELAARQLAATEARGDGTERGWLDPVQSVCVEVTPGTPPFAEAEMICTDVGEG